MSAWAQAAWIISQLNNRFDFQQIANKYQQEINDTAEEMQNIYNDFFNQNRVIVSKNKPTDTSNLIAGSLWLGLKDE